MHSVWLNITADKRISFFFCHKTIDHTYRPKKQILHKMDCQIEMSIVRLNFIAMTYSNNYE